MEYLCKYILFKLHLRFCRRLKYSGIGYCKTINVNETLSLPLPQKNRVSMYKKALRSIEATIGFGLLLLLLLPFDDMPLPFHLVSGVVARVFLFFITGFMAYKLLTGKPDFLRLYRKISRRNRVRRRGY